MHLAQLNVARMVADTDDPRVAGFMENLDRINGLGKRSPGFVWIMEGEDPTAGNTDVKIDGDPRYLANLTVWEDIESLGHFVWNTVHRQFYERRAEWFEAEPEIEVPDQVRNSGSDPQAHFVMWWVPEGHRPTMAEALERLAHLRTHGDTDEAFGWDHVDTDAFRAHRCRVAAE